MQEILEFLRDLQQNNNREWFAANKERYESVQKKWYAFCSELLEEIIKFDPSVKGLSLRDITYRIYRDTRFSLDKSPYKTHLGVFICPGGKKTLHSGYYFHIGTGIVPDDEQQNSDGYPYAHMLATGNYCYDKRTVQILHEDISYGWEEFKTQVLDKADKSFHVDMSSALKKVPKEYPADAPYADWVRLKSFCLIHNVDNDFITSPQLAKRIAALFATTRPFNDYINRAVDYRED